MREQRPDLLFLDVQMPGMSGLEVLEQLPGEERPAVVLTTAFDQYAVRAFEEDVVDYLLKPFDRGRFEQALERVRERLSRRAEEAGSGEDGEPYPAHLRISRQGSVELIDVAQLHWVESADQYVLLHTEEGDHLMRESMAEMERRLDPARFLRVHRSALVALERIERLESRPGRAGRVLLRGGVWVPVSRVGMPKVRRRLAELG